MRNRGRGKTAARLAWILGSATAMIGLTGPSAQAATTTTWTGTGADNNFNDTNNWSGGFTTLAPFDDFDFNLAPNLTNYPGGDAPQLSASIDANGLIFDAAGWTISTASSAFALSVGNSSVSGTGDGILVDATGGNTGTVTISAPLQIGITGGSTSENIDVFASDTLQLSGAVSAIAGAKLNATGPGTVLLNGTASGLGDINASAGTVQLDISGTTGGKLEANGTGTIEYLASSQVGITSTYRIDGSGDVNLNDFNQTLSSISFRTTAGNAIGTGAGSVDLNGGTLTLNTETSTGSFSIMTGNSGNTTTSYINSDGVGTSGLVLLANSVIATNDPSAAVDLQINAPISGTGFGITKTGLGELVLSGSESYTGTTTLAVSGNSTTYGTGTLALDFSQATSPNTNIISSSSALAASGGTLILKGGSSTANSQTFASLSVAGHAFTSIQLLNNGQNLALNVGAITRAITGTDLGATVDFVLPGGTQSTSNGVVTSTGNNVAGTGGILGAWATVNGGAAWAQNSSLVTTSSSNFIQPESTANLTPFISSGGSSSTNYYLNATGTATTETFNTLEIANSANNQTLTISNSATLSTKGILYVGSGSSATSDTYTISGPGSLTGGSSTEELIANVYSGQNLILGATISSGGLTKGGSGTLTITGANTYTTATYVVSGALALSNATGNNTLLGNTPVTVNSGAILSILKNGGTVNIGTSSSGTASLTLEPGATLNMADGTVGVFNINQTSSTAPLTLVGADTLDFDLGSTDTDEITMSSGGTKAPSYGTTTNGFSATNTINIDPVSGSPSLATGTFPLIDDLSNEGGLSLSQFALAESSLVYGGVTYDLLLSAPSTSVLDLTVTAVPEPAAAGVLVLANMVALRRRPRRGK
jgi:fibronectin-binding autotransporter adhesin